MKKQRSLPRRVFSHSLLIINIIVVIWSAVCWLAAFVSPAKVKYIAISNITLPFVIVAHLFFIFFWLIFSSKKIRSLYSLLTLIAGYKIFLTVFGLNFFSAQEMNHGERTIKVLSWNVHGMGIFERHNGKQTAKKILEKIRSENADIVCLPEYYTVKSDSSKPFTREIASYGYSECYFCFDNTLGSAVHMGTVIFSKYPIRNYQVRSIGTERINVLQCDINMGRGKIIRLISLHMHSFGLSDHDKYYLEELKSNALDMPLRSDVFTWKFNYAYGVRATESDTVAELIHNSPYPVLVCGDLNDLPGSYTYTKIRGTLTDAFLKKGRGLGRTYNELSPTLRIDHIFYDQSVLELIGFKCSPLKLSDHRPLIANFKIL